MTTHFKKSGFVKPLLIAAAFLTGSFNRAQAQEVVTGMSNSFGILGASAVSASASAGSLIGDIGVSPSTGITLGGMTVTGGIYPNIPPAVQAHTDAQLAYNQMGTFAVTPVVGVLTGQDLGGKTLNPGVYSFSSSAQLTGILTLSGAGQYVFQIASTLTTASGSSINLINGANASDVYFAVGSSATLGTNTAFQGSIYAMASGTMATGSTLNGRLVTLNGAISLDANTITNTLPTSFILIVNATTFDLGANRNEPVGGVVLTNAGQILGTGTSTVINSGNFDMQDGLVTAILGGTGSVLNKTTNGTVTLSAANTYTGGTNINGGTLAVTNIAGSATGTGAVTVANGSVLTGTGTVGNVTVNAGGLLVPGSAGVGNLSMTGLTLAPNSITNLEFNGTANDQVAVTGSNGLVLGNGSIVDLYQVGTTSPFITLGTYPLMSYVGSVTGAPGNVAIGTTTSGLTFTLATNGTELNLTIATASGPGSWSATGGGNWSDGTKWTGGVVASGVGNTAVFGSNITAPSTVTVDGNRTVGGITFGNANSYTVGPGTGSLTLDNAGATAVIAVSLGNHTISAPITLTAGGMTAQVSVGTNLTISSIIGQSAPAGVTKAGLGGLTLSGLNTYTGATVVTAGTLTDGVSNAISSASNLTVNGTTAVFDLGANHNNTVSNVTLDGNGSITGTGTSKLTSTGGFQVMNGTVTAILAGGGIGLNKTTNGTVTLSGLNTYTGSTSVTAGTLTEGVSNAIANTSNLTVNGTTAVFNLGANHNNTVANVTLDGNGSITGTGNSTLTSTGGFQVMNGTVTAILAGNGALNKTTFGTVTLGGANAYTGTTNVTAGTLVVTGSVANTSVVNVAAGATYTVDQNGTIAVLNNNGTINGNSTLTAGTYNLGNGTLINTSLGNGTLVSNGNVSINSTLGSNNITVQTGTMTLQQPNLLNPNATLTINSTAVLVLGNGNTAINTIGGNGTLDEANGVLTIANGIGTFNGTVTGGVATDGSLTSSGNLNLAAGTVNVYPNGTTVTAGTLLVNGLLVTPLTTVDAGATLGGNGTVTGDVVDNGGTVSPGNSPGIITIGGNYTEAGTLKIEIAGTSGPGSPTGHDQVVVGGNTTIIPATSTLNLVKFNPAYEPALGDTFKIISGAAGSITGHFGTFTSNFTTDLIYATDTGKVVGTGLPAGTSVLVALPGLNANQKSMITSLKVGDHQYAGGDLLPLLLTPANAAKSAQILNQASPEVYAGFTDYAERATQAYHNTAVGLNPVVQSGSFSLFAGYSHADLGSESSQTQSDYNLQSDGAVFGARVNLGPIVSLGIFTGFDFGSVEGTYLSSTVNGQVTGVFVTVDPLPDHRLSVSSGFSYGNFTTKGSRQTFSGSSSHQGVGSTDYRLDLGASYLALQIDKFSLTPDVNFSAGQSHVDDFTETNAADPLQALHVNGQSNTSFVAGAGLSAGYAITSKIDATARFGVSEQLDHSYRDVTANVAGHAGAFTARAAGLGDTEYHLGTGINFNVTKQLRLSLSYQAGFSTNEKMSNAVFLGVSVSF